MAKFLNNVSFHHWPSWALGLIDRPAPHPASYPAHKPSDPQARQHYASFAEQLDSGKKLDWAAALSLLFKVGVGRAQGLCTHLTAWTVLNSNV